MTASRRPARVVPRACLCAGLVAAWLAPACGKPPPLVIDRVHDLIALIGRVEFSRGSPYVTAHRIALIDTDDDRDGIAYVQMPAGTSGTYPPLFTGGPTTLTFGCGVGRRAAIDPRPVTFRIEERVAPARWTSVFERTLAPSDLPDPGRIERHSLVLAGEGPVRRELRFSVAAEDGGGEGAAWPAWFSPRLVSDGREVQAADWPIVRANVALDLIGALGEATVVQEDPDLPVVRDKLDAWAGHAAVGGPRTCVRMAAPARVEYVVTPPDGARLRFSFGVDTVQGWKRAGDGMTFAVEVAGERVWEQALDAHGRSEDRGWRPAEIDLARWAGREVALALVTEPGADTGGDVGGFANPLVLNEERVERRTRKQAPTVIVVLVDTLRADRLGIHGHPGGLSPALDAAARAGVRFDSARSVASWTWPSVASLFTGLYPYSHGVYDQAGYFLAERLDTLAERFAASGWTTGAFVASLLIGAPDNFDQGFETFVQTPYATGRAINRRFFDWLDGGGDVARFVYLHYFDPHNPYRPPAGFAPDLDFEGMDAEVAGILAGLGAQRKRGEPPDMHAVDRWMQLWSGMYDAEVRYFDRVFDELLAGLGERGILDDCIIAFTSDHGEEFFEHELWDHGGHLYDETIHVPLWITGYGRSALAPRSISEPVEALDLAATLCRLVGLEPLPGDDLLAAGARGPVFGQTDHGNEPGIAGFTDKFHVLHQGWKLIVTPASGRSELYHLDTDPGERTDRFDGDAQIASRLRALLDAWKTETLDQAARRRAAVDEESMEKLEALGYLGRQGQGR